MTINNDSLQAYFDREATDLVSRCTTCGKCVEVCPVLPGLGPDRPDSETIIGGITALLQGESIPDASAAWGASLQWLRRLHSRLSRGY